ncbi:MAG: AAA family ATPase [Victivallales bacterium]|nr:AAA family ATPase [Victivallales bacterium]
MPRTDDGVLYPMLALLAIKLSVIHGYNYTPEMAAEELYDMEMVGGTEYMSALSINGPMAPTFPRKSDFLPLKYSLKTFDFILGTKDNLALIAMRKNGEGGDFLPVSFWSYAKRPFPLTFPAFHTAHTLLYNKDLIREGKPVYLTEYLELADQNIGNENCVVVAFIGGEKGIPHNDFSPLASKKVVYLLLQADDEDDTKRAYRVVLKAFAEIHKTGNRSFEVFDCKTSTVIPTEQVKRDAIGRGLLEADEEDMQDTLRSYLPWPKQNTRTIIVGRTFQSGCVGLLHGSAGVGKSLMAQAISTVAATGKSMDNGFFEFKGERKCRILVIQSEMPEDAIAERQRSLDGRMGNNTPTKIELHACKKSLTILDEQAAVLQKLATLDPKGESQWLVWIDTIKSTMPEVLNGNGIAFAEKVLPWAKIMADAGISVTFIHHDNAQEKCSGPGTLRDLAEVVWHITPDEQARPSENCVRVTVEKPRYLTGPARAPARWRWATDENKQITSFSSEFLDGEDTPPAKANATESNAESSPRAASEEPQGNILGDLPRTMDELRALDSAKRRTALFELWNVFKTKKGIANHLGVSESQIEKYMKEVGVSTDTKDEYFRQKLSNGTSCGRNTAAPSSASTVDGKI